MRYSMLDKEIIRNKVDEYLKFENIKTLKLHVPKSAKSTCFRMEYYLIDDD